MSPAQLTLDSFHSYQPKARQLAGSALALLQQLPPAFTPFLLKEIIDVDVKFPVEEKELRDQLTYLQTLSPDQRVREMQPFADLKLNAALESSDWVNMPGRFVEQLSAHLWATHQMDGFRTASEAYVRKFHASLTPAPLPAARVVVVVIGQGARDLSGFQPFLKLKREGTLYTQIQATNGLAVLHAALEERAQRYPAAYSHWCLDGGTAPTLKGFCSVGYGQLAPIRDLLTQQMLSAYQAQHFDPEMLRSKLAQTSLKSLGIQHSEDAPLDHFSLTLLTEGSGTQIYSTTFVQWAAREALRRAQPLTLFARYAPRQREQSMDELLRGAHASKPNETDAYGSLVDADMGAYYTWLNQQRLPGADQSRFLVWLEDRSQAVVVSASDKRGAVEAAPVDITTLVQKVLA